MFNSNHYIPILKWKTAEQGALASIKPEDKEHITPLVQFVMPNQKKGQPFQEVVTKYKEQLVKIPEKINEVWGSSPIFLDFSLLYDAEPADTLNLRITSAQHILNKGHELGARFIPVIHITDDSELKTVISKLALNHDSGLCLRLVCTDLGNIEVLNGMIKSFINDQGLSKTKIDLIVDVKEIEVSGNKYSRFFDLAQKIEGLIEYRSYTFASGSFPIDLSECKIDEENLLPRADWQSWIAKNNDAGVLRKPAFSDYTIQYPIYNPSSQFFHPSTSIKYSLENEWLIMRGKQQEYDLYLANAKLLAEDSRFAGEDFSAGDKYISEKAKHFDAFSSDPTKWKTGNAKTWIEAGISHHFALVARQVANLL